MPSETNIKRPLLMIGAGRSGTSWLMDVLFRHPDVQVVVDNTLVGAIYRDVMNTWWSPAFLKVHCGDSEARRSEVMARTIRDAFCTMFAGQEPHWVTKAIWDWTEDSFGGVSNEFRTEVFPGAKYLHFVRDPRTCLPSMLEYFGERGQLDSIPRCERAYCAAHRDALRMRELGVECLVVRQEEIRDEPRAIWEAIESFAGMERWDVEDAVLTGEVNASKSMLGRVSGGRVPLAWDELTKETQRVAGALGYEVPAGVGARIDEDEAGDETTDPKQATIERLASEKGFLETELRAAKKRLAELEGGVRA